MNLSIIIPAYNAEKYIKECLESIIKQKAKDFEVVIINDGSKDKTEEIVKSFQDDRIKLYKNEESKGVSYSRNYGIKQAKGNYLMFVDADDILESDWYKIISKEFNSKRDVIYFSNKLTGNETYDDVVSYIIGNNEKNIGLMGPFSKIFRKNFLEENEIKFKKDIINGEDMLLNLECIIKAQDYKCVGKSFYKYRIVNNTSTKRFNPKIIESDKKFHIIFNEFLDSPRLKEKYDKEKSKKIYGGMIVILSRLGYLKDYKSAKPYFKFINEEPYKSVLKNTKLSDLNLKNKVLILMLKMKLYHIIYRYYKNSTKKFQNESFIII